MQVVSSALPVSQLPTSMRMEGVKPVCGVESVLNERDMKLKNRHWYQFRPKYYRAQFDVRVIVGAADLKFQLVGLDGIVSKDHEEIQVEWTVPTREVPQIAPVTHQYGVYPVQPRQW